jgi:thioredoxin 1
MEALNAEGIVEVLAANWDQEVTQSLAPVLLFWTADWCSTCRLMRPVIEEIAATGHRVLLADVEKSRGLAEKNGVYAVPTMDIFTPGVREPVRYLGTVRKAELLAALVRASRQVVPAKAEVPDDL